MCIVCFVTTKSQSQRRVCCPRTPCGLAGGNAAKLGGEGGVAPGGEGRAEVGRVLAGRGGSVSQHEADAWLLACAGSGDLPGCRGAVRDLRADPNCVAVARCKPDLAPSERRSCCCCCCCCLRAARVNSIRRLNCSCAGHFKHGWVGWGAG